MPQSVIGTQADRVVLYDGTRFCEALFGAYPIDGRTGRGDTVTVSFLVRQTTWFFPLQRTKKPLTGDGLFLRESEAKGATL